MFLVFWIERNIIANSSKIEAFVFLGQENIISGQENIIAIGRDTYITIHTIHYVPYKR